MYLQATDPLTTPAIMIVGMAMPKATLVTTGLAEPSEGRECDEGTGVVVDDG
jgi:hypothetical protein